MARLITWIDDSSAERRPPPSAKAMHCIGHSILSWCLALVHRVKSIFTSTVPVGYEDETGFHYGEQITEEQSEC